MASTKKKEREKSRPKKNKKIDRKMEHLSRMNDLLTDKFQVGLEPFFQFEKTRYDVDRHTVIPVILCALSIVTLGILQRLFMTRSKGPSQLVKTCCVTVSAWSIAFCLFKGVKAFKMQVNKEWPESFGLFCGLGAVAIAQMVLISIYLYHRTRYLSGAGIKTNQVATVTYSRPFINDAIVHFSNPGAFLLLLPYLSLTWMFRLMPESYYVYETKISWFNVFAQLFVVDFFTFVLHVAEHALPEIYILGHKPHHKFTKPRLFDAFDGSLPDTIALILFPLYTTAQLLHVGNWDYVAFGVIYSSHFMMIHSEFSHSYEDVLSWFFVNTSQDHHVHHATFIYNFSHFFTIYDKLAQTYRPGSSCKGFSTYKNDSKQL